MLNITTSPVIVSTSPATGRKLGEVPIATSDDIKSAMVTARLAQEPWDRLGLPSRLALVRGVLESFYRSTDTLIDKVVAEQGRPRFEVMAEFLVTIELIRYFSSVAGKILAPQDVFVRLLPWRKHRIEYRPFGVVLVITPWNFPLVLSVAPILAALIGGNTVIFKPSEFSTQLGELLVSVFHQGGIPDEVLQIVHGDGKVGAELIAVHPDKIAFTGSAVTGRKVAAAAGNLLIPVSLELGGKDAAIVLGDADLNRAAEGIVWGGMHNAGQACASVERVYVMRPVADRLVQKMVRVMNDHIRLGPGEAYDTSMGAITTEAQRAIISSHVREAVAGGARVIVGGRPAQDDNGQFYLPTLITDVKPDMHVLTDETFGPVIVVVPVDSHQEALRLANDSRYGLTGSIWTRNTALGLDLARHLKVGNVGINDHLMSSNAPNLPWGGVRESGYGRTRGREGLLEMVTPQAISVDRALSLPREFFWYPYTPLKTGLLRRLIDVMYAPTWREKWRRR
ncbi:MAG TPA: aldehyde dehydrogenase family protein [Aggregatilineales bacterium]|nr:aldehyde dehydrogenase family protein [Aggregatilineales bacterium]